MSKTELATTGILGLAFLFVGAAPAFAAAPERVLAAAPQGVVAAAPQVAPVAAPVIAPSFRPQVAPVVRPEVTPVIAPALVIAPGVHPAVGLPGLRY
jgi:hypothetical protein